MTKFETFQVIRRVGIALGCLGVIGILIYSNYVNQLTFTLEIDDKTKTYTFDVFSLGLKTLTDDSK